MKNLSILIKSKISDDKYFFHAINNKSTKGSLTLLVGNPSKISIEEEAPFFNEKQREWIKLQLKLIVFECFKPLGDGLGLPWLKIAEIR